MNYYRSLDPVLGLLKKGRWSSSERPYAGYLLFLFGKADEEIATWFARNLVALDSLTGSSLAGLVFAERVKLRVQVGTTRDQLQFPDLKDEAIKIEKIKSYEIERLVSRSGEVLYREEEELTAITYGADHVARELGLQADLPCIAILDVLPTEDIGVLRLRDYDPKEIIHLLRELAAKFTQQERFRAFFDLMDNIHSCCEQIDSLDGQICDLQRKRAAILDTPQPTQLWPEKARVAFLAGRHREFRGIIRTATGASPEQKQRILDKLKADAPKIVELARTISSLQYYNSKFGRLDSLGRQRLTYIIETHVSPYLPDTLAKALDEKQLQEMSGRLLVLQRGLENEYASCLPNVEDLMRQFEDSIQKQIQPLDEELHQRQGQVNENRRQLEEYQREVLKCEIPRLQHTFHQIAIAHGIALNSRKTGSSLVKWISGFLKADILIKLGELVAKHYGYIK
ncbi:MAG TPA: hypothetical protein VJ723_02215 [Candidatus Angelobacter sp.]|nr:hypothetical protein [Candidatus Angelobacter sp.]